MHRFSKEQQSHPALAAVPKIIQHFNKNPREMYKYDMCELLYGNRDVDGLLPTKDRLNLSEIVLENIFVDPKLACPMPGQKYLRKKGIMKDNNVSSFELFQTSEPDYLDVKFNTHTDIEHILNESSFTFPSSVLSNIDLENLNFSIFDEESYDTTGDESSKEFDFENFASQKIKEESNNICVHSQNSFDSYSFTSEETESDIFFTAFDCLDLLEQFEAVESLEPSKVTNSKTAKSSIGLAHLCGGVSILKNTADRTFSEIVANIRSEHNYTKREDAGPPTKKRKLNIEEYKNRKGLPRSIGETTVETKKTSRKTLDEKTAIQQYNQEVNELKMKILIAQPKSKIGGFKSPAIPTNNLISPKIEAFQELKPPKTELPSLLTPKLEVLVPKTEAFPMLIPKIEPASILTPKTEAVLLLTPKIETCPMLTPKTEVSPTVSPKPESVPIESKPSIKVKTIGINTDLTGQNESHRMFLARELSQISKMSLIVEKVGSKIKSTSLITAMMQNIKDKQRDLLFPQEGSDFVQVESEAVVKKLKSTSETVDAITQTDLTLSKNLLPAVSDDPISLSSSSRMEMDIKVDMKRASFERRILYVGDLTKNCTKQKLQKRFEKFGKILQITLHFKRCAKYYGFIVYDDITGVSAAIDNGNKVSDEPLYYLNFGGRKEFLDDQTYFDFDSHPENRNSNNTREKTYEEELMEYESLRVGRNS